MKGKFSNDQGSVTKSTAAADTLAGTPPKMLLESIAAVIGSGACIMFAATRNGDAVMVRLLNGNDKATVYASSVQEMKEALQDAVASVT